MMNMKGSKERKWLLETLEAYADSDMYPFHMPGHKRKGDFPNPYSIDITEIEGFDNLHHPEGILKESMEWAASIYGADKTYYLVNGSSGGILAAICGLVPYGGKLLMSRNCHKSAYHGVILNHLETEYGYPQMIPDFGIQGGLLPCDIENLLKTHKDIQAVLVVSPTYDGIVSDIQAIADIAHSAGVPLIVDEAHGAHFGFGEGFPVSALELGADVVIQSLHKTLPSFTQTALLHVREGYVDLGRIERYLQMYQTSSPSYLFLAGIESCIRQMENGGRLRMKEFESRMRSVRTRLSDMKYLKLLGEEYNGRYGVFDIDISKLVVSCAGTNLNGVGLSNRLREVYHLEMEMSGPDYVTAITTLSDSEEGLERLVKALLEIDDSLEEAVDMKQIGLYKFNPPLCRLPLWEATEASWDTVSWQECDGRISGEFVYLYPPGIPIIAPGEEITAKAVDIIWEYKRMQLPVQGLMDAKAEWIRVVKKKTGE